MVNLHVDGYTKITSQQKILQKYKKSTTY